MIIVFATATRYQILQLAIGAVWATGILEFLGNMVWRPRRDARDLRCDRGTVVGVGWSGEVWEPLSWSEVSLF